MDKRQNGVLEVRIEEIVELKKVRLYCLTSPSITKALLSGGFVNFF